MVDFNYLPKEEIAVDNFEDAVTIQKILLKNHNAVMMTQEENLYVLNWIWCDGNQADRNKVIFVSREDYEMAEWSSTMENNDEAAQ